MPSLNLEMRKEFVGGVGLGAARAVQSLFVGRAGRALSTGSLSQSARVNEQSSKALGELPNRALPHHRLE